MIGAIAGDVIGSPFEQKNVKRRDFPLFQKASTFTDDTVMTLALADALLHGREIAATLRRFYAWYPRAGYGHMFSAWARDPARGPYGSYGNGSAMRVAAAAYAGTDRAEVLGLAAESAAVTHDHPEGVKGAEAIALATFLARTGHSKEAILDAVIDHTDYDLDFTLDAIRPGYAFDATCQGSVPQALVAFREGADFEDTIRAAISMGGDSDTIACMAGAVAGAFYGPLPPEIDAEVRARLDERLRGVLTPFEARFPA
ncbi:MAG: ADP-ribosylglycohydrolase family protein [Pseudomonadota bacterium]